MEDVLEVYSSPYNENFPVLCMDEKPLQLLADARCKIKMESGKSERIDNEYIRKGTCCIFLFTEPLSGWRYADACEHRKKIGWAHHIKWLLEEQYPDVEKVVLVMDNPTRTISHYYEAFRPEESLHTRQCLGHRRSDSLKNLNHELKAWYVELNHKQKGIDWQFSTDDARIKLLDVTGY